MPTTTESVSAVAGSTNLTSKKATSASVIAPGDWYIDMSAGRLRSFSKLDSTDKLDYTVDSSSWATSTESLPGVIPDARQTSFTSCRISKTGSTFYLWLPPRVALSLSGFKRPERYPSSTDVSSNEALDTSTPKKLWQSTTINALNDEHYRYRLPKELLETIASLDTGDAFPEGFLYLWNQNTRTIVEDVVFKKSSLGNWIFEISSDTLDFSSFATTNESQASYNSTGFSIIVPAAPITRSLYLLQNAFYSGTHNNTGDLTPLLNHSNLLRSNPPASTHSDHGGRYPNLVTNYGSPAVFNQSRWAWDDHVYLLSRVGSTGSSGTYRDENDNAMLGDLVLASNTTTNNNRLNLSGTSMRLMFGTNDGDTAPTLYGEENNPIGGYGITLENANLFFTTLGKGLSFSLDDGGPVILSVTPDFNTNGLLFERENITNQLIMHDGDAVLHIQENDGIEWGLYIESNAGKSCIVISNGASPAQAALNISPSAVPSAGLGTGDIFILSAGNNRLQVHDGNNYCGISTDINTAIVASSTITGTAEQAFDINYTLPANTLKAGTVVKVKATGTVTSQNGADELVIRFRVGGVSGTLIAASQSVDIAVGSSIVVDAWFVVRTIGASGTLIGGGTMGLGTATYCSSMTASATVDTTATQQLVITSDFNSTNANDICRLDTFIVEIQ